MRNIVTDSEKAGKFGSGKVGAALVAALTSGFRSGFLN